MYSLNQWLLAVEYMMSAIVAIGACMIVRGFWPLVAGPRGTPGVRSLTRAIMFIVLTMGLRSAYWSFLVPSELRHTLGRSPPNILFSLLLIVGGLYMLRVLLLTIPESERERWNLWTAPFYPRTMRSLLGERLESFIKRARGG